MCLDEKAGVPVCCHSQRSRYTHEKSVRIVVKLGMWCLEESGEGKEQEEEQEEKGKRIQKCF